MGGILAKQSENDGLEPQHNQPINAGIPESLQSQQRRDKKSRAAEAKPAATIEKLNETLFDRFRGQKLLLLGERGHGKSSLINSFSFVVNLAANPTEAEFREYARTSEGNVSKTLHLRQYNKKNGLYSEQDNQEVLKRAPTFYDTCGLANRTNYSGFILALLEGRVAINTDLRELENKLPEDRDQEYIEPKPENVPSTVLFVVSAMVPLGKNLMKSLLEALENLHKKQKSTVLATLIILLFYHICRYKAVRHHYQNRQIM